MMYCPKCRVLCLSVSRIYQTKEGSVHETKCKECGVKKAITYPYTQVKKGEKGENKRTEIV